jgi:hypothetical protein
MFSVRIRRVGGVSSAAPLGPHPRMLRFTAQSPPHARGNSIWHCESGGPILLGGRMLAQTVASKKMALLEKLPLFGALSPRELARMSRLVDERSPSGDTAGDRRRHGPRDVHHRRWARSDDDTTWTAGPLGARWLFRRDASDRWRSSLGGGRSGPPDAVTGPPVPRGGSWWTSPSR